MTAMRWGYRTISLVLDGPTDFEPVSGNPGLVDLDMAPAERIRVFAGAKGCKPDEVNVNSTVSYYLKGGFIAMMLDHAIRTRSGA